SLSYLGWRSQRVVKIDIFVAIVTAHTNGIAFVRYDVNQGVLAIKTSHRGVLLANCLARFDGKTERKRIGKQKAYDGMRDPGGTPVINSHVHTCDLREPHFARFPVRCEIGGCVVVAISHVVNCDLIAIDLCPGCLCNIWLPRAVVI